MPKYLTVLQCDVGDFECPPELEGWIQSLPLRKDGQPDRRYAESRKWWVWFESFNRQKLAEWASEG